MPIIHRGVLGDILRGTLARLGAGASDGGPRERLRPFHSLRKAIREKNRAGSLAVIAEFKKASPRGIINLDVEPDRYAMDCVKGGAAAISILTEPTFFLGNWDILVEVAAKVSIPILAKDFILSPSQLETAYRCGADVVLLIASILEPEELETLLQATRLLGLEAIVEVHSEEELDTALQVGAELIGVNNRNLQSLEVDLSTSEKLLCLIPSDKIRIAESGISTVGDAQRVAAAGGHAILVGTTLMRSNDARGIVAALSSVRPDLLR